MGVGFFIDVDTGVTYSLWDGDVGSEEAAAHMVRLAGSQSWPPGPRHLTDLTTAGNLDSAFDRDLLGELTAGEEQFRAAILAAGPADDRTIGYQRSAEETASVVSIFHDLSAACAWLGIDAGRAGKVLDELRRQVRN